MSAVLVTETTDLKNLLLLP